MSAFILAHQQPNQLALSLLAMSCITFAMRSGETLARGDSDGIARLGYFELRGHDRSNQST
jgi:hypothetical protein